MQDKEKSKEKKGNLESTVGRLDKNDRKFRILIGGIMSSFSYIVLMPFGYPLI